MEDMVLENLSYLDQNKKNNLKGKFSNDVQNYVKDGYDYLFSKWEASNYFDVPSGIVAISVDGKTQLIQVGDVKYPKDTIFDIASMTKLYTEVIFLEYIQENGISLNTTVGEFLGDEGRDLYKKVDKSKSNLKGKETERTISAVRDLTLLDLMSFNRDYRTVIDMRDVEKVKNKKSAHEALRTSFVLEQSAEARKENHGKEIYKYTDLPIMILTDILEFRTKKSYKDLFQKYIVEKYDLTNTYLELDEEALKKYVSINGKYVNDPKADVFGGYYGHAGVKVTPEDFVKFLNVILKGFNQKNEFVDGRLFTDKSKTVTPRHQDAKHKAIIGNSNLSVPHDHGLNGCTIIASDNLPELGFAVQGSVRCQGETCVFNINGEEHVVSISLMLDCYTQQYQMEKYIPVAIKKLEDEIEAMRKDSSVNIDIIKSKEKKINAIGQYLQRYSLDDVSNLTMVDMRSVLPYDLIYRPLLNIIGEARTIALYQSLTRDYSVETSRQL